MVQSAQFGSYCDTAEYESDVHTIALNVNYQATPKLLLNGGITYNKAEDSWNWDFADRPQIEFLASPTDDTGTLAAGYDSADINNLMDEYSDLSYEQYQITAGGTYNFTDTFYTNASLTYDIFDMGEEFVYGDESGDAYYGYVGFGWTF
jgi:long-subunit fatty acid transport protein